jgi:hypothetical protein
MTTKQIAEFSEVSVRTVRRWVDKLSGPPGQNVRNLPIEKIKMLEAGERGQTVNWSEDEVYLILEAGGRGAVARWMREAQAIPKTVTMTAEEAGAARLDRLESMVEKLVGAVTVLATGSQGRQAAPALVSLPPPPEIMPRDALKRIVEAWARSHGRDFHGAWANLYREYLYRYHRDISRAAKAYGSSVLDYAEEENIIGELLALAYYLYGQKETATA